jgi:hypothetical protein
MRLEALRSLVWQALRLDGDDASDAGTGWFRPGLRGQKRATDFSWRFVLQAATTLLNEAPLTLYATSRNSASRLDLLNTAWLNEPRRTYEDYEVLVDFAVFEGSGRSRLRLTAESEMYAGHRTTQAGDYAWDLSKLLLLPSPSRFFLCRVGDRRDPPRTGPVVETEAERLRALQATIGELLEEYRSEGWLRNGDALGIAILAAEQRDLSRLMVLEQGVDARPVWDRLFLGSVPA